VVNCSSCRKRADSDLDSCPGCGQKLESNSFSLDELGLSPDNRGLRDNVMAVLKHEGAIASKSAEPIYYSDEKGVFLTPTILVVPGKKQDESPSTYTLANITSVKSEKDISARIIGIVGAVFGMGLVAANKYIEIPSAVSLGTLLIVFGGLVAIFMRPTYHLKIAGSHGEADVLKMNQKQDFERVMAAINKALVKKGQVPSSR
jgi:hypothetical protein